MKKKPGPLSRMVLGLAEILGVLKGASPFEGAAGNRLLMDWALSSLTTNEMLKANLQVLRARSRDLARNNSYFAGYLLMAETNIIGPDGFTFQAVNRDDSGALATDVNETIEDSFYDWSSDPVSIDGRDDLVEFQVQGLRHLARDGEAFIRLWRGFERNRHSLALELIDPALCDEMVNEEKGRGRNAIRLGVEIDDFGAPVAYYFRGKNGHTAVPADQIIHVFVPQFAGQMRGIPWVHPAMVALKHLHGYEEAELVAARVGAAKMGFFTNPNAVGGAPGPGDEQTDLAIEATPGTFGILPPGYGFEGWTPDHPAGAYPAFIKSVLRQVAVGLGVSYNALASDLENVNYSSMRSGLLMERDVWRRLQRFWAKRVLRRVHLEWLNSALLTGTLVLPQGRDFRRYAKAAWMPRGWTWVDPLKDIQAGVLAIKNGLASRTDILAEAGQDFEEVLERLAEENELATEHNVSIVEQTPGAPATAPASGEATTSEEESGGAPQRNGNGHVLGGTRRW